MLIKPVFLFLIYVSVKDSNKKFKLFIPLPLMFVCFLAEDFLDIISFLNFVSFGKLNLKACKIDLKGIHLINIIKLSRSFLYHIVFKTGKLDIVNVDVEDADSHVVVSIKTR